MKNIHDIIKSHLCKHQDILANRQRLKGMLSDCLAKEKPLYKNLLLAALEEGIDAELIKNKALTDIVMFRIAQKLVDHHGIEEDQAKWAIVTWFLACDKTVSKDMKKILKNNKPGTQENNVQSSPVFEYYDEIEQIQPERSGSWHSMAEDVAFVEESDTQNTNLPQNNVIAPITISSYHPNDEKNYANIFSSCLILLQRVFENIIEAISWISLPMVWYAGWVAAAIYAALVTHGTVGSVLSWCIVVFMGRQLVKSVFD